MDGNPRVAIGVFRGAAAVTLGTGDLEATFLPEVGMLGASLRHRGDELLALPDGLAGYRAGHVAGLPLLAPWANRLGSRHYEVAGTRADLTGLRLHTDDNGVPIHGTMTAQDGWEIVATEAGPEAAVLHARFDYGARPDLLAAFPFPHVLDLQARLGPGGLSMSMTLTPTADRPVPLAFGWHPYFRLPGAPRRAWLLALPARHHLALDARGLPTGASEPQEAETAPIAGRTFDDLYELEGTPELSIEGDGRRVSVAYQEGYPFAQVFAPPGKGFACIEPMTAPTNSLVTGGYRPVAPGDSSTARFSIRVEGR